MIGLSHFSDEIDDVLKTVRNGDLRGALAELERYGAEVGSDPTCESYWRYRLVRIQVDGYLGESSQAHALLQSELAFDPPTAELSVAVDILRAGSLQ